jgi:hypothetical protein
VIEKKCVEKESRVFINRQQTEPNIKAKRKRSESMKNVFKRKIVVRAVLIVCLSILASSGLFLFKVTHAVLAAGPTPPSDHPRVFARPADLTNLRAKTSNSNFTTAWNQVITDSNNTGDGTFTGGAYNATIVATYRALAYRYLLYGDTTLGNRAITMALNAQRTLGSTGYRNVDDVILGGAEVYDWCYNLLTSTQKTTFISDFKRLAATTEIGYPPLNETAMSGHGAEEQLLLTQLAAGIATYSDDAEMYNYVSTRFFNEYVPGHNWYFASGNSGQGDSYGITRYQYDLYAAFLFTKMGFANPYSSDISKIPYYYIYERRPDGQLMRGGDSYTQDDVPFGTYWKWGEVQAISWLGASFFNDGYIQDEANRQFTSPSADPVTQMLLRKDTVTATSVTGLPLTFYKPGPLSSMVARTGWTTSTYDPHSNIAIAEMRMPNYFIGNHEHLDTGSFQLYYKGGLAISSGIYQSIDTDYESAHDLNYHKRSIAQNTMTIYDPSETFHYYSDALANDGGQRTPDNLIEPPNLTYQLDPANGKQVSTTLGYDFGPSPTTPDYSYLSGDLTKAYSAKISDYKRSMVFLNTNDTSIPGLLFVYDKVTSANASFKKSWLLHSMEQPVISGTDTNSM